MVVVPIHSFCRQSFSQLLLFPYLVMRVSLLVGLFAGLSQAATDLYTTWEVDPNCAEYGTTLANAYMSSSLMVDKALKDLEKIQKARPQPARLTRSTIAEIRDWDRIARAVTNMFGFRPDRGGHSKTEEHMGAVLYVFERMNKALQGPNNVPERGYARSYDKPLIMCGTSEWEWIARNKPDPNDPAGRKLSESKYELMKKPEAVEGELAPVEPPGAWVHGTRYIDNNYPAHVRICIRESTHAVTMTRWDLITFCKPFLDGILPNTESLVDRKNRFNIGDTLDPLLSSHIERVMIHEFAHYYGADGYGTDLDRVVHDYQAVSPEGDLVWTGADGKGTRTKPSGDNPPKRIAYSYVRASRLAVSHTGNNAGNSGPKKATFNAENFAYFAIMAYVDNFDWSGDGTAKEVVAD
ncbi:hypothetical protein B0J13DRAFT_1457 [Dactylonectria estremocensis]|uniref:Uncharacterized protein n=1 Tax=Dactylonectria estremocensis TaxID=1079267 RepID=A0A9P9FHB0_9HYPO|nr:hypothetical protein B0J13DRAFT_1457 [Dactylonectria estremocensis]